MTVSHTGQVAEDEEFIVRKLITLLMFSGLFEETNQHR